MTAPMPYAAVFGQPETANDAPTPLEQLLERRTAASTPDWLGGAVGHVPATARPAAAAPPPPPEPEPEPEPVAPPAPPEPDPEVTARMAEAIESLRRAEASLASQPDVVELGLAMAQAILQHELAARPELVVDAVQDALVSLRGEAPTRIRVHPELLEALRAARPDLEGDGVELVADPALGLGGCIVESRHRALDASVEERVARFRQAFLESLQGDEP